MSKKWICLSILLIFGGCKERPPASIRIAMDRTIIVGDQPAVCLTLIANMVPGSSFKALPSNGPMWIWRSDPASLRIIFADERWPERMADQGHAYIEKLKTEGWQEGE
jgi:hypothetical protein